MESRAGRRTDNAIKVSQKADVWASEVRSASLARPTQSVIQAPHKMRMSHKLFALIQAEGYQGSEASVQMYGVRWRKGHRRPATFLPLEFDPGQDAQADWGEAQVILAGVQQTVQVFVMHLSYSRRTFVMCFPAQKQEAFLFGHVRPFEHFGGIPHAIPYDNLRTAVQTLIEGRVREEQRAFLAFRSHYLFSSHYCTPAQGHEKGGVEGDQGYSRRNFLVPIRPVSAILTKKYDVPYN